MGGLSGLTVRSVTTLPYSVGWAEPDGIFMGWMKKLKMLRMRTPLTRNSLMFSRTPGFGYGCSHCVADFSSAAVAVARLVRSQAARTLASKARNAAPTSAWAFGTSRSRCECRMYQTCLRNSDA